ncbi:MAG: PulJ/GspJ family protein [Desulfobulbia bacterium]
MKEKGFTLVEVVITMLIISIIMAISGTAFKRVLFGVKEQTKSVESNQDKLLGLELFRLDLEHVGFGIARNTTAPPLAWTDASRQFTLRSTLNNTNQTTLGWHMANCTSPGLSISNQTVASGGTGLSGNIVLLGQDKSFQSNTTFASNCPDIKPYFAFPYDNAVTNGCGATLGGVAGEQYCNRIVYELGATTLDTCAPGTSTLYRKVGADNPGDSALNCVADIIVRFDLDTNIDGTIDVNDSAALPASTSAIIDQVRNIDVFVLQQIGQRDQEYTFAGDITLGLPAGVAFNTAGITEFNKYRWKVLKLSGKPMSW